MPKELNVIKQKTETNIFDTIPRKAKIQPLPNTTEPTDGL